ncbi:MAG: hypothetical protein MJ231_02840 [bacterium]|nr:hypothetical protein [bacterium]
MIRFIIVIVLAIAAFWCYNNFNFEKISNDVQTTLKNEKTVKAVNYERSSNYQTEQDAINNEN